MKKDLTKHTRSAWKQPVWWKYIVAFFIILINALPLYVLIEMSLKQSTDLASRLTWPDYIYLGNYLKILKNAGQSNLLNAFKNTILVTACVVGIEVFCGCLAAYPLARLQTKFNEWIRSVNLAIMMIPPVSILVGVYSILVKFNGINTHWALILVTAAFGLPLSIYLYTNYITAIPRALDEAATIDGANRLQCFLHIILPQLNHSHHYEGCRCMERLPVPHVYHAEAEDVHGGACHQAVFLRGKHRPARRCSLLRAGDASDHRALYLPQQILYQGRCGQRGKITKI